MPDGRDGGFTFDRVDLDLVLPALTTKIHGHIFKTGTVGPVRHNIDKYSIVATTGIFYS